MDGKRLLTCCTMFKDHNEEMYKVFMLCCKESIDVQYTLYNRLINIYSDIHLQNSIKQKIINNMCLPIVW